MRCGDGHSKGIAMPSKATAETGKAQHGNGIAMQSTAKAGRYQANQVKHAPLVGHGKTSAGNERRYTRPHRRSNDEQLAAPARQSDAAHSTGKAPHGFTVHRHAIVSSLTQWHGAAQRTTAQAMLFKASQGTGNAPQRLTQHSTGKAAIAAQS